VVSGIGVPPDDLELGVVQALGSVKEVRSSGKLQETV
jgi:hypothetical protein